MVVPFFFGLGGKGRGKLELGLPFLRGLDGMPLFVYGGQKIMEEYWVYLAVVSGLSSHLECGVVRLKALELDIVVSIRGGKFTRLRD